MIIKNHDIELKDTSASEMARFRQIMLSIWRQQIEDDKNSAEMIKYVSSSTINNGITLVSVTKIIESIKNQIGKVHDRMLFHDLVAIPNSMPDGFENFTYNDSQGNVKEGGILLKWNQFKGINLVPGTFQAFIEIGTEQTDFTLTIFNNDLTETAFKFTVHDFDLFMALFKSLGIKYSDTGNKAIIDLYLKNIKEAKNDPNKLDVIYESLPKILFGKMEDADLYKHLDLILNDMYVLGGSVGTNEDKAILQILYAIKDRKSLYMILNDIELLYKIYTRLQGEEMQHLLRFLTRLVGEFDTSKTADTVYFDNSYYLFRDTHVETDWSGGEILINNYKNSTKMGPKVGFKNPMEIPFTENYIANKGFNPLAKLNFGTKLGNLGEQTGDENTFVIVLKLHNMATKQSNWDLFNVATDLLSLLSAYGALRVVLAKGAPIVARAIAGVVLAKDATHYAMLSNGTLEKWHENGYGWLAKLWIAFSVTVDLASFGLPNLSKIAKEGNAAAELAETVEDAKEIRRVADEANRLIEVETGKDVSKMSDKEYEDLFDYLTKWDGKDVSRRGYLGARKLSKKELNVYIRKINEMSNGKSEVVILPVGDKFLKGNKAAFHPFSGTLYVQKGVTEFEIFHEFKHFEEFKKIGRDEYLKGAVDISGDYVLDAIRTYKREKYVFDEIMKNKSKFNNAQIARAQEYMEEVITSCRAYNIDVTKIK
ncbi:hypothetical protein D3C85_226800 [compost metagenome]